MRIELHPGLDRIDPSAWDALCGPDDPFVEYGFLSALELSGSVGEDTGWVPIHVTVWQGDELVGAAPTYAKLHSYGEYIFDWSWAHAAERMGIEYYPKVVVAIPHTPATGRRLLVAPEADRPAVVEALIDGVFAAAEEIDASGVHWLFANESEKAELCAEARLEPRLTYQYHWHNPGYASFDEFLADFRSKARKEVRRERRKVRGTGLQIEVVPGSELGDEDWRSLDRMYRDTCARRGSFPYLTRDFWGHLRELHAHRMVAVVARDCGRLVASTINFAKGPHLYGRYWGCIEDHDLLHFELCYYRLIEHAISERLERFEAGAQGRHKIKRGFLPSATWSAHHLRHPALGRAVSDYLLREAIGHRADMLSLTAQGPFRRGDAEGLP
jgi:predicted N-acyltransferase